jgi:hypothetical protein
MEKILEEIINSIIMEVEDKGEIILLDSSLKELIFNEWGDKLIKEIVKEVKERY